MAGTVKPVDLWLLIECRSRWECDAMAMFPAVVQKKIGLLRSRIPRMRLALIKQTERGTGPLSAFWAFGEERAPRLYRAEFENYEELSFDLDRLPTQSKEKMFAVCTHGVHDLCCAQFGNKIYSELASITKNVWHISHVGGCRFAPNVLCLPHGIVYGRVEAADCAAIVSGYRDDSVHAAKLRGRSCYSKPVQAAERFLRAARGLSALEGLRLTRSEETQPGQWLVGFLSHEAQEHRVAVSAEASLLKTYKSCSANALSPRETFRLVECM
jgi:hypothetical protein